MIHILLIRGDFGPGVTTDTWTKVGPPDTPQPPEVISWDKRRGTIRVKVNPVEDNGGQVRKNTKKNCYIVKKAGYACLDTL